MFSAALELILNVAYREAAARRHTHLTLEHLLYALAHDPDGEKILAACGGDLPALRHSLDEFLGTLEQFPRGARGREPDQTLAFQRVLQTAVLHVQSAGKDEVRFGDVLAAILQQPNSYAAELLQSQDITRLDVLNYISHGISKIPTVAGDGAATEAADAGAGPDGPAPSRDPLTAFAVNLTDRATRGQLDPLIGRTEELQRTIEILCRRRKNNPVFVGDAGVGKTALAEGLACRLLEDDVPTQLRGAEVFALDTAALLAGTRFRGDFEERFKAVVDALAKRPTPILFIDEVHTTVGAGATTGGTMDLAHADQAGACGRRAPDHRLDHVRRVQAHRAGPGAGTPAAESGHRRGECRRDGRDSQGAAVALREASSRVLHRGGAEGRIQTGRPPSA